MQSGDFKVELDWRNERGQIVLEFFRVCLGFRTMMVRIRKASGDTLENDVRGLPTDRSLMFRIFHGIRESFPVLEISDEDGNYIRFYRARDRKGRERIRVIAHGPKNDTGGDLLISQESYDAIVATLDSIPLHCAAE